MSRSTPITDMDLDEVLELPGEWEIRATIYRNGKKVAFTDALGDGYSFAVQTVVTNLERPTLQRHIPRTRGNARRPGQPGPRR